MHRARAGRRVGSSPACRRDPRVQAVRQSWYALPSVFSAFVNPVNCRRAGVAAALSLLLASTSPAHGDATSAESTAPDAGALRCGDDACQEPAGAAESTAADSGWEEIKRESCEAIDAWKEGARAAARATWATTEEVSSDTLDAAHEGSAAALDSTRQDAEQVWEEAREDSKQLWEKAKPTVAGAVSGAARGGEKAWNAAREAGRTFWQTLTAEDAGNE